MKTIKALITKLQNDNSSALAELYGSDTEVRDFQRLRYIELLNKFQSRFSSPEAEVFSSPGRTEIGGKR